MFEYQIPGVYRQEVTIRAQPRLPTGIPGFVGFADARNDGDTAELLLVLPPGLVFPDNITGKLHYDAGNKELAFKGQMTCEEQAMLLGLSPEQSYAGAVRSLYAKSQREAIPNEPIVLHRQADFDAKFVARQDAYLADAVTAFFGNGGARCYVVRADPCADPERALTDALEALAPIDDLDLIAIPDAMTLRTRDSAGIDSPDEAAITRVQKAMLMHCVIHRGRSAILDSRIGPAAALTPPEVIEQRARLVASMLEPVNGALYYPWVILEDGRKVPPCGHIAGVYARTDVKSGYFKAPANEEILGIVDLETPIGNSEQAQLNPEGVNCLRAFAGRGIRVWGARTISRDPNWRYVNVRRLFLTLGRWIDLNMAWASFEPNTPRLWFRITRELGGFLDELWRAGALAGKTREQAYYVRCDNETNPPETREAGQTVTEVGLAPGRPAEFIVVRIVHHTAVEPR